MSTNTLCVSSHVRACNLGIHKLKVPTNICLLEKVQNVMSTKINDFTEYFIKLANKRCQTT